ncbi:hypothetical protein ACTL32_06910 [Planococcus sp. FY231025]|uniref:hypothetical protein n=1 Tax=Planococcus sp. FY231025 TaxID=3455699 RepID=UPI003F8F5C44
MLKFIASAVGGVLLLKAGGTIESYLASPSKLNANLEKLDQEVWFRTLREDYRYNHIIEHNGKIRKYLSNEKNADLLLEDNKEQERFTALVHEEFELLLKRK